MSLVRDPNTLPPDQRLGYHKRLKRRRRAVHREHVISNIRADADELRENGQSARGVDTAYIYVVSNNAFPGWYKVGTCVDLSQRLSSYQTSDPNRSYKYEKVVVVKNRFQAESNFIELLQQVPQYEVQGEWVKPVTLKGLKRKLLQSLKESKIVNYRL